MKGKLILSNGKEFYGDLLEDYKVCGEVVFNTGMTGYQEIFTDPSYCDQIVTLTYPLVGNYGVKKSFNQGRRPYVKGVIIGELCNFGTNWDMENQLVNFLKEHKIPTLYNVDTRAVTKAIRSLGATKGIIVPADLPQEEVDKLMATKLSQDEVQKVTIKESYVLDNEGPTVVVMDFGIKQNILDSLHGTGLKLVVMPAYSTAEEVMSHKPDGLFLSNGPGDPKALPEIIAVVKDIAGKVPTFGICLGHQLLALAFGGETYKMKFGHRGSNQPVQDLDTKRVYITSQNHGYAVDEKSLKDLPLIITHRSVNDNTVEGLRHKELPVFSVQYHPEASPGPDDNRYLFQQFCAMIEKRG